MKNDTKVIPMGPSLVVLIGPSGSGKSSWAELNFQPREVVSSDAIREELTGDLRRQDKNDLVFNEFYRRIETKIKAGSRVIADATNIRNSDRKKVASIGHVLGVPVTYVVINRDTVDKIRTGGWRNDVRIKGVGLIEKHEQTFVANEKAILSGDGLASEVIDTRVDNYRIAYPLPRDPYMVIPHLVGRGYNKLRVIGDVHGNSLGLNKAVDADPDTFFLFLGDIVDYGPGTLSAGDFVSWLVTRGEAAMVRGNHERKIMRYIEQERGSGFTGQITNGNDVTVNQLKALDEQARLEWEERFRALVELSPDWIQIRGWLFTHGAAHPKMWNEDLFRAPRNSKLESIAMFGETTGEFENGYPVRIYDWVDKIPPKSTVVVGHAVLSVEEPVVKKGKDGGQAIFLDTGSSKEFEGQIGHLSWMDFEFTEKHELRLLGYGRE